MQNKNFKFFILIINMILAIFGAIFISLVVSYILIFIFSWFKLEDVGRQLTYSIIAVLLVSLFSAYFKRFGVLLGDKVLFKKFYHVQYFIIFIIPFLFLNRMHLEGSILLSLLFSLNNKR